MCDSASLFGLPTLEDLGDVAERKVLLRADFNVPLKHGSDGQVSIEDDFRIRSGIPTLLWLLEHGAKVTVCSHLGRPKSPLDLRYSMAPVISRLSSLLEERYLGGLRVLENLRFSPGEQANDPQYLQDLIAGQELYVNDAFGVSHRNHASIVGPPKFLRSAAGTLVLSELEGLSPLMRDPPRPFVAVIGGAKVSDKLGLVCSLSKRADAVLIGGGMAFTFLRAMGLATGASIVEEDQLQACRALINSKTPILLPCDSLGVHKDDLACAGANLGISSGAATGAGELAGEEHAGWSGNGDERVRIFGPELEDGWCGLDIGPSSAEMFAAEISTAASLLWNGPMGMFEDPRFASGTEAVARAVSSADAYCVVGGGDSVAALDSLGLSGSVSHLSTGGGATLSYIEHGDLPGLSALRHCNWAAHL